MRAEKDAVIEFVKAHPGNPMGVSFATAFLVRSMHGKTHDEILAELSVGPIAKPSPRTSIVQWTVNVEAVETGTARYSVPVDHHRTFSVELSDLVDRLIADGHRSDVDLCDITDAVDGLNLYDYTYDTGDMEYGEYEYDDHSSDDINDRNQTPVDSENEDIVDEVNAALAAELNRRNNEGS